MKKDLGIKIFFIVLLLISIYLIISGLTADETVPVTNTTEVLEEELQVNPISANMIVGEELQINATIIPDNATYKNLTWESANNTIASVENGVIKANSAGSTIIKVSTEKRKITKMINVKVSNKDIPVEKIVVNNPKIELYIGDTSKIEYTVEPDNATNKSINISVEDKNIAAFNTEKLLVGVNKGTTNVILKSKNGIEAKIEVNVKEKDIPVSSVSLSKSSISLKVGESETITAQVKPSNATHKETTWSSSDNNIAKVENGKITAIKEGTATITVKTNEGGKTANCTITVRSKQNPPIVPSSSIYKYEGSTFKYYVTRSGDKSYYLTYIWMEDPYNQVKKIDAVTAEYGKILKDSEITGSYTLHRNAVGEMMKRYISYGIIPASKAAIGFNASGFYVQGAWNPPTAYYHNRSDSWYTMNEGIVVRNNINDNAGHHSYIIGIDYNGDLKIYDDVSSKADRERVLSEIQKDKIKTTWSFYPPLAKDGKQIQSGIGNSAKRQVICQVNSNNYMMMTVVGNKGINDATPILLQHGCKTVFNLDGGGSTSMFIKKPGEKKKKKIVCSDGSTRDKCRSIVEGIYFTEK